MNRANLIKVAVVVVVLSSAAAGFWIKHQADKPLNALYGLPEPVVDGTEAVAGYRNWKKINDAPAMMPSIISASCVAFGFTEAEKKIMVKKFFHRDKFINVYVNEVGEEAMMTRKNPSFPVGTVIVKEKLVTPESTASELLTVMIKREKGFNPEVGDWEFMTLNGSAAEVTSIGKLENCQACHVNFDKSDFIARTYLPKDIEQKLK